MSMLNIKYKNNVTNFVFAFCLALVLFTNIKQSKHTPTYIMLHTC